MKKYDMKTARPGIAAGKAYLVRNSAFSGECDPKGAEYETEALKNAAERLRRELSDAARKANDESRPIIEAEIMLLDDPELTGTAYELIKSEDISAENAVIKAGKALADKFSENENQYIRSRADDVNGLVDGLVGILSGDDGEDPTEPVIIVARELSPARLSRFDMDMVCGIVTEKGSPVSHVSIIAGNYGIPYIYGSAEAVDAVSDGNRVVIDDGILIIGPDDETYTGALNRSQSRKEESEKTLSENTVRSTKIYANAGSIKDIENAKLHGAEGIGLLRTEFLFLDSAAEPSEEEQFAIYRSAAEIMGEKETTVRTMDIGSDKKCKWLPMSGEENPALGLRGVRVSLNNEQLFKKQLRALMRAAVYGNIRILIPMIASEWEVDEVRRIAQECEKELTESGTPHKMPPVGIMIETPAAAMTAPELARKADFFSIGTNDLTQYALALDREGEKLDRYYDPCHEAVFRLIEQACRAAHAGNIPIAVCGELAGNEKAIPRLISAGVDELSVSPAKLVRIGELAVEAERKSRRNGRRASVDINAPADGKLVPMEDIPDPAFSSGSLGKCIGILPDSGMIYAPCDGTVTAIAETKHAITVESVSGDSILIHVGIDTVSLGGRGFEVKSAVGDTVSAGQMIMEADLNVIRDAGLSTMVVVVNCG